MCQGVVAPARDGGYRADLLSSRGLHNDLGSNSSVYVYFTDVVYV